MARHKIVVESPAGMAAGTTFANVVASTGGNFKVRRIVLGCRAGASVPTSQQVSIALYRATARGTQTTTVAPQQMDPGSISPQSPGADTAWSANPTLAANKLTEYSFNTQSAMDVPHEFVEELIVPAGNANGLAFQNVGNALPANHVITLEIEIEE